MKFSALKLLFFFLSFFIFLGILTKFTHAQTVSNQSAFSSPSTSQTQNSYAAPNMQANVPNNLHNYTQNVMLEVASGLSCLISGVDPVNPNAKCLGFDTKTGKIGYVENRGGAIGAMGNMIAMLYTPPAHTRDYVMNLAQNFGVSKTAFARIIIDDCRDKAADCYDYPTNNSGVGFQSLSPLIRVWEAFRNIVYLLFVLVFIVIGVAIMLRIKIDPRTVMTIQNQIPKIIIGLILVTFSFAIAGFLIDLMWTAIYLIYGVFQGIQAQIPGLDISSLNPVTFQGDNPIGAAGGIGGVSTIAHHAAGSVGGIIASLFDNTFGSGYGTIFTTLVGSGAGLAVGGPVGAAVGAVIGGVLGGVVGAGKILGFIGGMIAYLIIVIALLWALFRVWFTLLMAYIMILIDVVFAPFWILAGLLPGSKLSFNTWLRDIVANLAAFPAVIMMFLLGRTFIDVFATAKFTGQFVPPLIGNPGDMKSLGALIGLGIILTTPNAVKMMKTAFGAPQIDLSSAGAAIGAGAAAPGRLIGGTISTLNAPHWDKEKQVMVYPSSGFSKVLRGFGIVR